jgi:mRNA (2'-O-methyladenosine-N6-)-methyltransferase
MTNSDTVYCHCRTPNDDSKPMVACDGGCDDWFHLECVGLTQREAANINQFLCPFCTLKKLPTLKRSNLNRNETLRPIYCIPFSVRLRQFDLNIIADAQRRCNGRLFDALVIHPPWLTTQFNTSDSKANSLFSSNRWTDAEIELLAVPALQTDGFLFMWTNPEKFNDCLRVVNAWGYAFVDQMDWVDVSRGKSSEQPRREICVIALKGQEPPGLACLDGDAVVFAEPSSRHDLKPTEFYNMVERLLPNGFFLELFGTRASLRDFWTTLGDLS